MSMSEPIAGWKLNPKSRLTFALIIMLSGLLSYFQEALGIPEIVVFVSGTAAAFCASAFILPHAKIWRRTTRQ